MRWGNILLGMSLLVLCSVQDMKKKKIKVAYPLLWGFLSACLKIKEAGAAECLIGCLPGIFLMVLSVVTGGAIGLGDGLLMTVIGMITGLRESLWILLGALLLASVLGLGMLTMGRWHRKHAVPFVPFLLAAYLGVAVWGRMGVF